MSILTAYNIPRQLPTVPGSGTGIRARVAKHARPVIQKNRNGGKVNPIALAVLRLMISSNAVGCSTRRSVGFASFKIMSTRFAARRYLSGERKPCLR